MPPDPVVEVRAGARAEPLPKPLRIGPMEVRERHYTWVEVECRSGVVGTAFAQSRGAPVAEIVTRLLAPLALGRDAGAIADCWNLMFRGTVGVGRVGLVLRALSLVDLALWDAAGKRAGKPVFELLGGARRPLPVTFVAGYPLDRDDLDDVTAAAVAAAAAGHRTVKVARTPDPALTLALLEGLEAALPGRVGVALDANWVWDDVDAALAEVGAWPARRLRWIEDPFLPERPDLLAALRSRCEVPLAVGDELADPALARRLLDTAAVDLLRLDVATIGGITAALPLLRRAERQSVPVSFHISPETSIHLAAAFACCRDVETFDRAGNRFDPSHELVRGGPSFEAGEATPSDAPGLGFEIV